MRYHTSRWYVFGKKTWYRESCDKFSLLTKSERGSKRQGEVFCHYSHVWQSFHMYERAHLDTWPVVTHEMTVMTCALWGITPMTGRYMAYSNISIYTDVSIFWSSRQSYGLHGTLWYTSKPTVVCSIYRDFMTMEVYPQILIYAYKWHMTPCKYLVWEITMIWPCKRCYGSANQESTRSEQTIYRNTHESSSEWTMLSYDHTMWL